MSPEQKRLITHGRRVGKSWARKIAMALNMKPLFIPLKTEFYLAFKDGSKRKEYRIYGPRWNERTCVVGRRVTLSKGYGKSDRISGFVSSFERKRATDFSEAIQADIIACYGGLDQDIAEIGIQI